MCRLSFLPPLPQHTSRALPRRATRRYYLAPVHRGGRPTMPPPPASVPRSAPAHPRLPSSSPSSPPFPTYGSQSLGPYPLARPPRPPSTLPRCVRSSTRALPPARPYRPVLALSAASATRPGRRPASLDRSPRVVCRSDPVSCTILRLVFGRLGSKLHLFGVGPIRRSCLPASRLAFVPGVPRSPSHHRSPLVSGLPHPSPPPARRLVLLLTLFGFLFVFFFFLFWFRPPRDPRRPFRCASRRCPAPPTPPVLADPRAHSARRNRGRTGVRQHPHALAGRPRCPASCLRGGGDRENPTLRRNPIRGF
jgi:hypothetical protein